jgi:nucleoside permease NupC
MRFAEPRLFAMGLSILAVVSASLLECVLGIDVSETAVFLASVAAFLGTWLLARLLDRFANRHSRRDV